MKAKVLKSYPDKITNRWYNKDEMVDFKEERIRELANKGIVEIYIEPKLKKTIKKTIKETSD